MTELLSPVGSMDCLMAAINAGCNAVYLAGKNFGARSFASNFSREEMIEAINTCHLYGVKVYVTVNILIHDNEVEQFMEYIDFLHLNNVDALIMQDIGMIDLVHKTYPNLVIHASTQMNIHNLEGVKLCEKLGIKRVVLARETPIELIKHIKENTNMELEVFIHGALCMCYSGECLMSALIGTRSGNRGTCAQCCRQQYDLQINNEIVNDNKYLLSTKDLNTVEYIEKLLDLGITSLKIEGRMKRKEYVYLVTSIYRKAIDNYNKHKNTLIQKEDIINLKKIFNREFTKGFLFNEDNDNFTNEYRPNHLGIKIGKVIDYKNKKAKIKLTHNLNINDGIRILGKVDTGQIVTSITKLDEHTVIVPVKDEVYKDDSVLLTTDYNQINHINSLINTNKKIKIDGKCILKLNEIIKLSITDGKNIINVESDYIVENSKNSPISKQTILQQLNKLGSTIYEFNNLEVINDENIFIPVNILNELRRKAIDELNNIRMYKTTYKKDKYKINVVDYKKENNINILIHDYNDYLKIKDKEYNIIYIDDYSEYKKINDKRCILKLPRINETLNEYNDKLLVGELGGVYKYNNVDTDFSLNVFNAYSVALLHSLHVNKITLSYELNYKQIKKLIDNYHTLFKCHPNLEVITKGYEEVMVCKYNMLKKYNVSGAYLIDRFKNKYKIHIKNNFMYIYNYKSRNDLNNYFEIGINNIRINKEIGV